MSTQNLLTVDKATTIRQDGEAEFVTLDAAIQPDKRLANLLRRRSRWHHRANDWQPERPTAGT